MNDAQGGIIRNNSEQNESNYEPDITEMFKSNRVRFSTYCDSTMAVCCKRFVIVQIIVED